MTITWKGPADPIRITVTPKPEHTDGPLVDYLVGRFGNGDDAPRHARFIAGLIADYHRERGFLIVSEQGFDEVLRKARHVDTADARVDAIAKDAARYYEEVQALKASLKTATAERDALASVEKTLRDAVEDIHGISDRALL